MFNNNEKNFQNFVNDMEKLIEGLKEQAGEEEINELKNFVKNFRRKTADFYRENRKLNIGVIGQVKAGKSSFLNSLLFEGKDILPKASTPKTATLTKMEYSDRNRICIEYYTPEDWKIIEENAEVDLEGDIYTSARELIKMVRKNGIDTHACLEKKEEQIEFETYEELIGHLNDYVGENGKFTPVVKAATLYLKKEEFKGLSIVDTPGLNDPVVSRTLRTKEFIEVCDVVFFLSQAGSFLDKSDWELLSGQLPQKGVKKMILIGSKYDSSIRDVLRKPDPDDIFGDDDNTADTIPKACKMINKKLRRRAKHEVDHTILRWQEEEKSQEQINVIEQCREPVFISSIVANMCKKEETEYTNDEKNVFEGLKNFSDDIRSDLEMLGNMEPVKEIYKDIMKEKENIFEQKAKGFLPDAAEEVKNLLEGYREKAEKRFILLDKNDRTELEEQKKAVEKQINSIKADVAVVFGELYAKLEVEKSKGIRELRNAGKEYLGLKERTGTTTHTDSYTTGHLFWKKTHYYTYETHYTYFMAADVVENVRKYALEAVSHVEKIFTDAIQFKEIKRKLLNVVVNNFDMGNEKFDASLFKILVEKTISVIEFPIFKIDFSDEINKITGKFSGEITSTKEKTELSVALSNAISAIYEELCQKLYSTEKQFKGELQSIDNIMQNKLLEDIEKEFDQLIRQCENKEKEIAGYKEYMELLDEKIKYIAGRSW